MGEAAETVATREVESKTPQAVHEGAAQAGGFDEVFAQRFAPAASARSAAETAGHPILRSPSAHTVRAVVMRQAQHQFGNRALASELRRSTSLIQRHCDCGGTCASCQQEVPMDAEPQLAQREASGAGTEVSAEVIPANSPGHPLDPPTRARLENHLGGDLDGVRVHTDSAAGESATALQANAYTVGRDIYFAPGQYSPASNGGMRLLAHEAAHTLQQGGESRVPMTSSRPGVAVVGDVDDPLEHEAERAAEGIEAPRKDSDKPAPGRPPMVRRGLASFAGSVWDATGGRGRTRSRTCLGRRQGNWPGSVGRGQGSRRGVHRTHRAGLDRLPQRHWRRTLRPHHRRPRFAAGRHLFAHSRSETAGAIASLIGDLFGVDGQGRRIARHTILPVRRFRQSRRWSISSNRLAARRSRNSARSPNR